MADFNYIQQTGVIVPDTSATRAQVEAEFIAAFGADMPLDPSTPQGVLVTMMTELRDAVARNNADLANQINPDIAGGVFLDSLWRLTGGQRNGAVASLLTGVQLSGVPATLIPAGSFASVSATGQLFALANDVLLDGSGNGTGSFVCTVFGAVPVPIGGLDQVASGVLGWETVNNPSAAVQGRDAESDISARRRRRQTLALQTTGTLEAVTSRLFDIESVHSLYVLENVTNGTVVVDGVSLVEHSIWACVEGGTDAEVAQALFETKSAGADYNGAVTVQVTDPSNGRQYPVKFDRPTAINLLVRVTVASTTLDASSLIPQLVMNYVNGLLNGDPSFTVGVDVSPWEIAGIINMQEPNITVRKVELSLVGSGIWSTDVYAIAPDEIAKTQASAITVLTV